MVDVVAAVVMSAACVRERVCCMTADAALTASDEMMPAIGPAHANILEVLGQSPVHTVYVTTYRKLVH